VLSTLTFVPLLFFISIRYKQLVATHFVFFDAHFVTVLALVAPCRTTPTEVMVRHIDDHKNRFGVEPICQVLPIAPSTYYEQKAREHDPGRRPARYDQTRR
jgi:hypothetical protein